MKLVDGIKLDFKDILLVPQRSSLDSRSEVELERTFKFKYSTRVWSGIPIIASNMDTCGSFEVARALARHKMLTALHKFYSEDELFEFFTENYNLWNSVFYTVGANDNDFEKLEKLSYKIVNFIKDKNLILTQEYCNNLWPPMICLDAANGYTTMFVDYLKRLRKLYPQAIIMAGNIVTGNMAEELVLSGADIVKVGIGSGSVCLTRISAGIGVPQASAVDECAHQSHGLQSHVCSDGGITCAGDVCKALCVGADLIMIGGFFAGTEECSGDWMWEYEDHNGNKHEIVSEDLKNISEADFVSLKKKYLKFHGMSSREAMEQHYGGMADYRAAEGKEVIVPCKGPISDTVQDILGGIRSCCSYLGCLKIKDMPKCALFIRCHDTHNKIFGG
jgi:GMP reductase